MKSRYNAQAFIFGAWILIGLVMDIVIHTKNKWELPWSLPHLITYLGMLMIIISVVWPLLQKNGMDKLVSKYIRKLGATVFFLGGIGDLILHLMDVSESSFFSRPTHLLIILGAGLYLCAMANHK